MICEYAYTFTHIYTSTWHLPIGVRGGHIFTLSNAINANCSSKAELKLFAGRGTKGLSCHYICLFCFVLDEVEAQSVTSEQHRSPHLRVRITQKGFPLWKPNY